MLDISIVIPARNEEKYLPICLKSIFEAQKNTNLKIEIICVVNRSNDRTEEIARSFNCRVIKNDSKNLSKIRNSGIYEANGKYIITIDADSRMSKGMLLKVKNILDSNKYIGGGVAIWPERFSIGIFLTAMFLLPIIIRHRISGGLFFFSKKSFNEINGFDENLVSVEDIDFAKRLKAYGKSKNMKFANVFREYIITSCRKFDILGDWYLLKNPKFFISILKGTNQKDANKFWYDFPRE